MSVARELAKSTNRLTFEDLPPDVVHQTKRFMLDTLGCAIGGYGSEASKIIQEVIKESSDARESTVFGSGLRASCL
ncbi:MAG: MmgE/PrpD family protein, partial [Deltaproteobacteria bacterium]|nr:MmgE/PrpD family protein [Deltaproteobacteria bacterium]